MDASALSLGFVAAAIGGYLLGSVPFGLVLGYAFGQGDIRKQGSGNIGATNMLRTGRKDLAFATLLLDAAKAGAALLIARALFGPHEGLVAGGAAFIGHCFPVWLKFKGGKGVATFFGALLAGMPLVGAGAGVIWLLVAYVFRFSSLAALVAAAAAPVLAFLFRGDAWEISFCALLAVLIAWRHQANIARLIRGEEPHIGDKKDAARAPARTTPR